ncbi:MAG: hypothetical protein ABUL60_06735 [Myxococcales bacterium]
MRVRLALFELMLLASIVGCQRPKKAQPNAPAIASASALEATLAPRRASRFQQVGDTLRQAQPRLPDTGEWRCAERDGVVWCAGGEAAAGVVSGPADPGYRCGARWGSGGGERVCIDDHPDYPDGSYRCAFEQERGSARVCRPSAAPRPAALPSRALPACWLDHDCPSAHCERGACACSTSQDCARGRCTEGVCQEAKP